MTKKEIIIGVAALLIGLALGYWALGNGGGTAHLHTDQDDHSLAENGEVWTCSMHPQIRQDEPGICPICEMDLIPMESFSSDHPLQLTMTETAVKLAQVATTKVKPASEGEEGEGIRISGHLREDPDHSGTTVAQFPGTLQKLNVRSIGVRISAGDLIGSIYAPELRSLQLELLHAHERRQDNPRLYEATRNKMRFYEIDSSTVRRILDRGQPLDLLPVFAHQSGTVTELRVSEGDYVNRGTPLLRIADLSRLWAEFEVHESMLKGIGIGDEVVFSTSSRPGLNESARIYYIDPFVHPEKRTVIVRARVRNFNQQLKPQMLIRGRLAPTTASKDNLVVIPSSAVLWTGKRSVVYVVVPDAPVPTFEYREVDTEEINSRFTLVSSGLQIGEEVVTQGAFTIDAAAQLNNRKSMMNEMIEVPESRVSDRMEVHPDHLGHFQSAFGYYLQLKDELVLSNPDAVESFARSLLGELQAIPDHIHREEVSELWMPRQEIALEAAESLTRETDLEKQRAVFEDLSNAFIFWLRHFELNREGVYIQNCPMAFDNRGADWISTESEIKNPYFGDRMLRCGSVVEHIEL
nr:efflux RND transporter periplasmic adaptor subunit [Saprospiraceae bacterium]